MPFNKPIDSVIPELAEIFDITDSQAETFMANRYLPPTPAPKIPLDLSEVHGSDLDLVGGQLTEQEDRSGRDDAAYRSAISSKIKTTIVIPIVKKCLEKTIGNGGVRATANAYNISYGDAKMLFNSARALNSHYVEE